MAATHSYPTSKCQQIVLSGLGMTAENYTEAERKFEEIGILVVAIRQGRKSVPSIAPLRYTGGSEDERFNCDYADIIRENLSEYCNEGLLKMITPVAKPEPVTPVAQPVVAEQKEETPMTPTTTLEQALEERGMAEASYGSADVIVAFDDDGNNFVAKYLYDGMPPHAYASASTVEQLIADNPELADLDWSAVDDEEI